MKLTKLAEVTPGAKISMHYDRKEFAMVIDGSDTAMRCGLMGTIGESLTATALIEDEGWELLFELPRRSLRRYVVCLAHIDQASDTAFHAVTRLLANEDEGLRFWYRTRIAEADAIELGFQPDDYAAYTALFGHADEGSATLLGIVGPDT